MRAISIDKCESKESNLITNFIQTKNIVQALQTQPQFRDEQSLKNIEPLLKKPLFNQYFFDLCEDQLKNVAKKIKVLSIPPNKLFISKGTQIERFFILLEGYISINYGGMQNNQVKYLFPGDSIGSQSLLYSQQPNYNGYTGKDGCIVAFLEKEDYNANVSQSDKLRIQKYIQILKKVDLLKSFSEDQILQLYFASNTIEFPVNQYIYQINTKTSGFYIVIEGSAQVLIKKVEKDDLSVNYDGSIKQQKDTFTKMKEVKQGEFFGYYELIQRQDVRYQSVYSSSDRTQLIYLTNGIFWRFFTTSPSDSTYQILRSLVRYEEKMMRDLGGANSAQDLSPSRRLKQISIIDKIKPLDLEILKIKTPVQSLKSDSTPRLYDTKFINLVYNQGFSPLNYQNYKRMENQSPLSVFKKVVRSEAKITSQMINKDSNTQTFGVDNSINKEGEKIQEVKKAIQNANDVSTITPFSYDEDYFKNLEKQEKQNQLEEKKIHNEVKVLKQTKSSYNLNDLNLISQVEKLKLGDEDENTTEVLSSTPQANQQRNQVLKLQTMSDRTEETQLISDFQLNYLKEQQTKYQSSSPEISVVNNINLVFNNETLQKFNTLKKLPNQVDKNDRNDNNRRSKSLTSIRYKLKNNSPSPLNALQFQETQPKFLSPKYKLISSITPLTNSSLIKATNEDSSNQNTLTSSPTLKIKISRPNSAIRQVPSNTQTQFHERYKSVIQITQDCNHIGHKRALSQIFFQQKRDSSLQNSNNVNKNNSSILNNSTNQQASFAQKFITKMQKNSQEIQQQVDKIDQKLQNSQNNLKIKQIVRSDVSSVFNSFSPKQFTPSSIEKIEQYLKNARETSQNFNTNSLLKKSFGDNKQKKLIILRDKSTDKKQSFILPIQQQLSDQNLSSFTPRQMDSPLKKRQYDNMSGEKTLKSQLLKTMVNSRIKILKQNNNLLSKEQTFQGGFSDYIQQNKMIENSMSSSLLMNQQKIVKQ